MCRRKAQTGAAGLVKKGGVREVKPGGKIRRTATERSLPGIAGQGVRHQDCGEVTQELVCKLREPSSYYCSREYPDHRAVVFRQAKL